MCLFVFHELCNGVVAVAETLLKLGRVERNGLGAVEAQSARQALLRKKASLEPTVSGQCDVPRKLEDVPGAGGV